LTLYTDIFKLIHQMRH